VFLALKGSNAIEWYGPPMNKTQPFRQHHLTRALKAATAAGVHNPMVEVHLPTGAKIVVRSHAAKTVGKPGQSSRRGRR